MPDLKALKHFLHLSESLHFGRSSDALHVSPSTLSRSISKLEQEVGVSLFERDNRTVSLTEPGLIFREFAVQTLSSWRELQASLHAAPGELVGRIKIYCSVTASYSFMSTILTRFRKRHPGVEVSLNTGDASFAVEKILDFDVDLAIAPMPDYLPNQICFQSITETPLNFIGPNFDCPVKDMVDDPLVGWSMIPLILPEYGLSRKRVDSWFKKNGLKTKVQAEVMGHEAIVSMVGLGMGVGVVPKLVIDSSPMVDRISIIGNAPNLQPFNVGAVALERKLNDPIIQSFWQVVSSLS